MVRQFGLNSDGALSPQPSSDIAPPVLSVHTPVSSLLSGVPDRGPASPAAAPSETDKSANAGLHHTQASTSAKRDTVRADTHQSTGLPQLNAYGQALMNSLRGMSAVGGGAGFGTSQHLAKLSSKHTPFSEFKDAFRQSGLPADACISMQPLIFHAALSCIDAEEKIAYLLKLGADPNGQHPLDGTGAHMLLANECHDLALYFIAQAESPDLKRTLDLNAKDSRGQALLMLAIKMRSTKVATFLVEKGANCAVVDARKRTPLHLAAILGNPSLFELFLSVEPGQLAQKDQSDRTPLDYLLLDKPARQSLVSTEFNALQIDARRDEAAYQNFIIDMDWGAVERAYRRFASTKAEGSELMLLLDQFGAQACDNIAYGAKSVAYLAQQIKGFTGRSLLDACVRNQSNIRGAYTEGVLQHASCGVLNQLLALEGIEGISFQPRCKKYLPGFIDAVAELPQGNEAGAASRLKKLLPNTLLIRHYQSDSQGKQFLAVDHIQLASHQQALQAVLFRSAENRKRAQQ